MASTLPEGKYPRIPALGPGGYVGVPSDTCKGTYPAHCTSFTLVFSSPAQSEISTLRESSDTSLTPISDPGRSLFVDGNAFDLARHACHSPPFVKEPCIHQKFVSPRFVNILVTSLILVNHGVVPGPDFALDRESICSPGCRKQTAQLFHLQQDEMAVLPERHAIIRKRRERTTILECHSVHLSTS